MAMGTIDLRSIFSNIFKDKVLPHSIDDILNQLSQANRMIDKRHFMEAYHNNKDQFWKDMASLGFRRKDAAATAAHSERNKGPANSEVDAEDDFDIDDFLNSDEFKKESKTATDDYSTNTSNIRAYQRMSDTDAEKSQKLNQIVIMNKRLVETVAGRYTAMIRGTCLDEDDLIVFGDQGLLKSIARFNPDMGYQFSTYATWWIRQSITRGIADESRLIRLPVHLHEKILKVRKTEQRFENTFGTVDLKQLCENLRISLEDYWKIQRIIYQFDQLAHLDVTVGKDGDTELLDLLPAKQALGKGDATPDYMMTPDEAFERKEARRVLERALAELKPREAGVIRSRFGLDGGKPLTLEEVGQLYHLTRERIRQIEAKALRKLRQPSRSKTLKVFIER
ncbi:sigma-70 family RNA polymerase sigma factor [Sporolactobacillus vineae]|uniref:sigma-70 family RNA polymerase sigma factor n=1 Tax=Sporolactobacillus vineae TaxID=444463 RepID=UPI00028A0982|nr:sigma-70 family RNA polymerase sigma factor [Sporolactobacillus vineae]